VAPVVVVQVLLDPGNAIRLAASKFPMPLARTRLGLLMGLLTDYFAATPEQAAAVDIQTGPTGPADESARQDRPSVDGSTRAPRRVEDVLAVKGFEPTVTMATLEGILTGAEFMEIIESDAEPIIADGGPDGPWLVMVRAQLRAAACGGRPRPANHRPPEPNVSAARRSR
jgi:hypothetical protein